MKKVGTSLIMAALVLFLMDAAMTSYAQQPGFKPIKFKVASIVPNNTIPGEYLQAWEEEVTKRTNGAVTFETFWGASLGAPAEHIDLLTRGVVSIVQTNEWYTPSRFPLGDFEYAFPFGPTDDDLLVKSMRKIRTEFPDFSRDLAKANALLISDPSGGVYNFMSKKPLKTIDDFRGEKVALLGRYFGRWLPPGATAVVRPVHDRYDLLRGGVVNIDFLPFGHHYAFKIHEVANYYIIARITNACFAPILIRIDAFKELSPGLQKILLEAGQDIEILTAKEIIPRWWAMANKAWTAKGIIFSEFPREQIQKWASGLEDIPAEYAAEMETKGYPGYRIVQRWQEITSEQGFKWDRKWGIKK